MAAPSRKAVPRHVVMVATENDSLRRAKVGGIGDVIRDLPGALAPFGWSTTVIVPSYGYLHKVNPSEKIADVGFSFRGREEKGEIWRAVAGEGRGNARETEHLILHHPEISGDPIYFNDSDEMIFARDATKFALFCSAVGRYLATLTEPYVLHLHDWHTGYFFLLAKLHRDFDHLKKVRKIFTIHNVGYQGTRPLRSPSPAVRDWFPELFEKSGWTSRWKDPRYTLPTFTPMLAGIRHASAVTTVSPTYAKEIMTGSDPANAVHGGDGLESALRDAHQKGRLYGILNGTDYSPEDSREPFSVKRFIETVMSEVGAAATAAKDVEERSLPRNEILRRLRSALDEDGRFLLTSITRVTDQKVRLLFEKGSRGKTALDEILEIAGTRDAAWIFVGTGEASYEKLLHEAFVRHDSFLFLNGFFRKTAVGLFRRGDLFVMPSSYEPCGITQMLAMKEGQPCLVHAVGGLKDTVRDGIDGFAFSGMTLREKVDNLVRTARRAIDLHASSPGRWAKIVGAARNARFTWETSAKEYDAIFRGAKGGIHRNGS